MSAFISSAQPDTPMEDISPGRGRSNTVIRQPAEGFDSESLESLGLLSELRDHIKKDSVKAAFWACLQACDLTELRSLVAAARTSPLPFTLC